MAQEITSELTWKVTFLVILLVLIFGLSFLFFFLHIAKLKNFQINDLPKTPKIPNILGSKDTQPKTTPNAVTSPTPALTSASTPDSKPRSSPALPTQSRSEISESTPGSQNSRTPPNSTQLTLPFTDSFESGLGNWSAIGDVMVINQGKNPEEYTKPLNGVQMVRIGRPTNQGYPISHNQLLFQLPQKAHKLTFFYNFFSYDYQGFDDPGFQVTVDGFQVYTQSASIIDTQNSQSSNEVLDTTHWHEKTIEISQFTFDKAVELVFEAGNDELNLATESNHQSWVYLDSIKIE